MNLSDTLLRLKYYLFPSWALDGLWKCPPFRFKFFSTDAIYKDLDLGYDVLYGEVSLGEEVFYFKNFQSVEKNPYVPRIALEYFHSFQWLQHLNTINTQAAQERQFEILKSWLYVTNNGFKVSHRYAYKRHILVRRLINWLTCIDFAAIKDEGLRNGLIQATSFQVRLLLNLDYKTLGNDKDVNIAELIKGLEAKYICSYCIGLEKARDSIIDQLIQILNQQVLRDGGIVGESPSNILQILGSLSLIFKSLEYEHEETKNHIRKCIDRLITHILSLRYLDGKLATFGGGCEETAKKISFILASFPLVADPLPRVRLSHAGYMGLKSPNINVTVKTPALASTPSLQRTEADVMASEVYIGLQRIFVSSSLIIDGKQKQITHSNAGFKYFGRNISFSAVPKSNPSFRSNESWDILLIECNNYMGRTGLRWSKQIDLSKAGKGEEKACQAGLCMLCEDMITSSSDGEKLTGWFKFILHPTVCHRATISKDNRTIYIKLGNTLWAFRFNQPFEIKKEHYCGYENALHETMALYIFFNNQSSFKLEWQIAPQSWLEEISGEFNVA